MLVLVLLKPFHRYVLTYHEYCSSCQSSYLHVASCPIKYFSGFLEKFETTMGVPNRRLLVGLGL